jgi:hypothetical protein
VTTTLYSTNAGCFGASGAVGSFNDDAVTPENLFNWVAGDPTTPFMGIIQFLVDLPQGCTIGSANLKLFTNGGSGAPALGPYAPALRAVAEDNATWTLSYATAAARATGTKASDNPLLNIGGVTTWDVKQILQELVNRPGWVGGYVIFQNVTNYAAGGSITYLPDGAAAITTQRPTLEFEAAGSGTILPTEKGSVDLSAYFSSVYLCGEHGVKNGFLRMELPIPKNAIITSAIMRHATGFGGTGSPGVGIDQFANKVPDASFPADFTDWNGRTSHMTVATVYCFVPDSAAIDFDVTDVLSEIIAQASWKSHNHILWMMQANGPVGDVYAVDAPTFLYSWGEGGGGDDGGDGPGGQVGVNGSFLLLLIDQ